MGFIDEIVCFGFDDSCKKEVSEILVIVYWVLEEKGYNLINQIVGYLFFGDLVYIFCYCDV